MVVAGSQAHPPEVTAQILDLTARLSRGERAVTRIAAEPVRHITPAFIAALLCLDLDDEDTAVPARVLQLAR
jgi:hypothetical protein